MCQRYYACVVTCESTYGWPTVLLAIIVQHSSTVKDKEPPFPITSQIWRSLGKITLSNGLNLKIVAYFQYKLHSPSWNYTAVHAWILSSDSTSICYLALWSWLHRCFNHLMRTSTNCLYSITIRGIIHSIWWPPTFTINLSFELLHSLNKSSLFIVRPFSWLLCISKNLQKKRHDARCKQPFSDSEK